MRLSQTALFGLSCASFIAGLLLALLCDLLYMTRLWLTPADKRYTVPAIQRLHLKHNKKGSTGKKSPDSLGIVLFFSDVFLCILGAITLILLLYSFNNGAFRAAAPLCIAIGFGLWHGFISKAVRIPLQWVAFGIEIALYTLIMPLKRLIVCITQVCKKNAQKQRLTRLTKARKHYTEQILQNIDKSAEKLLPIYQKSRMQKGDHRARKAKKAV